MRFVATLVPVLLFLAIGLSVLPAGGLDDSYITFWPAHTLATMGEILNYNGDRIEQSSSLLLVLVLAAAHKLTGVEMSSVAWGTGAMFGVLTILGTGSLARRLAPRAALPAMLLTCTAGNFVYWSFSGMETSLVASTSLLFLYCSYRFVESERAASQLLPTSIATALLLLVRPESLFVVACTSLGFVALAMMRRFVGRTEPTKAARPARASLGRAGLLFCVVVILGLSLVGFRYFYFDSAFPQTVVAKSRGISIDSLVRGIRYITRCCGSDDVLLAPLLLTSGVAVVLSVVAMLKRRAADPLRELVTLFMIAYFAFILASGGDWMKGSRFFAHIAPLMAILAARFLCTIASERRFVARSSIAVLCAVNVVGAVTFSMRTATCMPAWSLANLQPVDGGESYPWHEQLNLEHRRDMPAIRELDRILSVVKPQSDEPVWILTGQGGMLLYSISQEHFGEIGTIDVFGLTDDFITSSTFGKTVRVTPFGLRMNLRSFVENYEEIARDSDVPRPDIVVDLDRRLTHPERDLDVLAEHGYELVYYQTGLVNPVSDWTRPIMAGLFICVRAELLPPGFREEARVIPFDDLVTRIPR